MANTAITVRSFPLIDARNRLKSGRALGLLGKLTNNELVARWLNKDYIRAYRSIEIPALSAAGERVVGDLADNGIAVAMLDEFFGSDALAKLRQAFDKYHEQFLAADSGSRKGKAAYIQTIHKSHSFVADDFVSEYLASQSFAAISARYMGMVPRFVGNSFWHTYPAPAEDRMFSQQWHRDYNDRRLVKVFLYLNDVQDNGPFEFLTGSHGKGALADKFNRTGPDGYRAYPDNDEMEELLRPYPQVDLAEVQAESRTGKAAPWNKQVARLLCTGKAGTLLFADTFGLHRGGYVRSGHRDLIMTTFSTNSNVHKPHFAVTPEFAEGLSPFMRIVFGLQ